VRLYISLTFQLSLGSFLSPERKEQKTVFLFFSLVGKERKVRLLSLARESKIKESLPSKKLCSRNTQKTYKTRETEQIFFDGCKVKVRAHRARLSKSFTFKEKPQLRTAGKQKRCIAQIFA
jgi:hypothetical protein